MYTRVSRTEMKSSDLGRRTDRQPISTSICQSQEILQLTVNLKGTIDAHDIVLAVVMITNLKMQRHGVTTISNHRRTSYRPTVQGSASPLKTMVSLSRPVTGVGGLSSPRGKSPSHSSSCTGTHIPNEDVFVTNFDLLAPI